MPVIWHQNIDRTRQMVSRAGMQKDLAKARMKTIGQPTRRPILHGMRPKHDCVSLVGGPRQSRQLRFLFKRHCKIENDGASGSEKRFGKQTSRRSPNGLPPHVESYEKTRVRPTVA